MLHRILLLILVATMSGCSQWSKSYSDNYLAYMAAKIDCQQKDMFTVTSSDGTTISAPAGHCNDISAPRHDGDVYTPLLSAGITAGALLGQTYLNNDASISINRRNAEASEFISEQNRLSNQDMFSAFSRFSDNNQATIDNLVTLIPPPVTEEPDTMTTATDPVTAELMRLR